MRSLALASLLLAACSGDEKKDSNTSGDAKKSEIQPSSTPPSSGIDKTRCDSSGKEVTALDINGERMLPIIPLVEDSDTHTCELPVWPSYSRKELGILKSRLKGRLGPVGNRLLSQYLKGLLIVFRIPLSLIWFFLKGILARFIIRKIEADLVKKIGDLT